MFKKLALAAATALAVTLAAGAATTKAAAAEFTLTIAGGEAGPIHALHDRGQNRGDFRRGRGDRRYGRGHRPRRGYGWRHTFHDDYFGYRPGRRGRNGRNGRRQGCRVHNSVVTVYDAYGWPHRRVKRRRTCGRGRY